MKIKCIKVNILFKVLLFVCQYTSIIIKYKNFSMQKRIKFSFNLQFNYKISIFRIISLMKDQAALIVNVLNS